MKKIALLLTSIIATSHQSYSIDFLNHSDAPVKFSFVRPGNIKAREWAALFGNPKFPNFAHYAEVTVPAASASATAMHALLNRKLPGKVTLPNYTEGKWSDFPFHMSKTYSSHTLDQYTQKKTQGYVMYEVEAGGQTYPCSPVPVNLITLREVRFLNGQCLVN